MGEDYESEKSPSSSFYVVALYGSSDVQVIIYQMQIYYRIYFIHLDAFT